MHFLRIGFALLWVGFFLSCEKEPPTYEYSLAGHGGSGFDMYDTPRENTPESVNYCVAFGADAVELDVQMSADGVLWTYHDEYLKDHSMICQQSSEALRQKSFDVYTLEETIAELPDVIDLYLDPKIYQTCQSNFDTAQFVSAIEKIQSIHHNDMAFLLSTPDLFEVVDNHNWTAYFTGVDYEDSKTRALENNLEGIMISLKDFSAERVSDARSSGLKTIAYNVRSAAAIEDAIEKQIDVIILDPVHLIPNY